MPLDEAREIVIPIDDGRSISLMPTQDGVTVVLAVEDPQTVALVELTQRELRELAAALARVTRQAE